MDDLNPIAAKGAQERAEAQRQRHGALIQELVQLGATRELAEYLVGLEIRIAKLEQGAPTTVDNHAPGRSMTAGRRAAGDYPSLPRLVELLDLGVRPVIPSARAPVASTDRARRFTA